MNVSDGVELYLSERQGVLKRSTIDKHRMTLGMFSVLFGERELDSITAAELIAWRNQLTVTPSSANKYMDRLAAFWRHMVRHERCARNPLDLVDRLDEPAARRIRLQPQILGALLDAARHPRDRALIAVAVELLLRGGELAELRVSDVGDGVLRVMVEKQKGELAEDEMAISASLQGELGRWLHAYRGVAGLVGSDAFLFPRVDYRRAGLGGDYKVRPQEKIAHPEEVIKLALANAGHPVPKGTGVHAIRRTCARLLFDHLVTEENADRALSHVSSLMHHSSRRTTELYLGITGDRVLRNKMVRQGGATPLSLAMATVAEPARPVSALSVVSDNLVHGV